MDFFSTIERNVFVDAGVDLANTGLSYARGVGNLLLTNAMSKKCLKFSARIHAAVAFLCCKYRPLIAFAVEYLQSRLARFRMRDIVD